MKPLHVIWNIGKKEFGYKLDSGEYFLVPLSYIHYSRSLSSHILPASHIL